MWRCGWEELSTRASSSPPPELSKRQYSPCKWGAKFWHCQRGGEGGGCPFAKIFQHDNCYLWYLILDFLPRCSTILNQSRLTSAWRSYTSTLMKKCPFLRWTPPRDPNFWFKIAKPSTKSSLHCLQFNQPFRWMAGWDWTGQMSICPGTQLCMEVIELILNQF